MTRAGDAPAVRPTLARRLIHGVARVVITFAELLLGAIFASLLYSRYAVSGAALGVFAAGAAAPLAAPFLWRAGRPARRRKRGWRPSLLALCGEALAVVAFSSLLFWVYWRVEPPVERPPFERVIWDGVAQAQPYDVEQTTDGRYLFVTFPNNVINAAYTRLFNQRAPTGVMRLDLATGERSFIPLDYGPFYGALFEDKNLVLFNSSSYNIIHTARTDAAPAYLATIEPFALTRQPTCRVTCPIRSYRGPGGAVFLLSKGNRPALVRWPDPWELCQSAAERREIPPTVLGMEKLAFADDERNVAWVSGEYGGRACRIELEPHRVDRCVWVGAEIWDMVVERGAERLWLSRPLYHKLDLRDARTGRPLGVVRLRGKPRALAADEAHRLLFVGMYLSGQIAAIDLDSQRVLRYFQSGTILRKLILNANRNTLLAVSLEGIYEYPLDELLTYLRRAPAGAS